MRLYRTWKIDSPNAKWSGSQAEAASDRAALVKAGAPRASIETMQVDVPTDKAGLLKWLNERSV